MQKKKLMARLLAEIRTNPEEILVKKGTNQEILTTRLEAKLEAKADPTLKETNAEIRTNPERMEARIEGNNEKFEAHRITLLSQVDIRQNRTEQRPFKKQWKPKWQNQEQKGEQREQLESNHGENRTTGKEGEGDDRRHKHSTRKGGNDGSL
jgi:hypothetical protein